MYNTYNYQQERFSSETQVLDLSVRGGPPKTWKTPSPYNSTTSCGTDSPSTHCVSPPTLMAPPSTNIVRKKPTYPQSPPSFTRGMTSLYPMCYPLIKHEIKSKPSVPTVTSNTRQFFPQHSPPTEITQKTMFPTPASQSSPQPNINSLPSLPPGINILFPSILNEVTTGAANLQDPLPVAAHFTASNAVFDKTIELYKTYHKRALDELRDTNGGYEFVTNPKMRRTNHGSNEQNNEFEENAEESIENVAYNGNSSNAEFNWSKNDSSNNNNINCRIVKNEAYFEMRRKNNAAAKKSRDRRRMKEDEIAIRTACLERQHITLLCQRDALQKLVDRQIELQAKRN